MGFVLGAFLLLLTISYLLARPLIVPAPADDGGDAERARDDLIRRIADLDFELATGKLDQDDHARLRAGAMAGAVAAISAARTAPVEPSADELSDEAPDGPGTDLVDDIERLVAARRRAVETSAR
jgi:hypothetical protein